MTSAVYDRLASSAARLLSRYGQDVTRRRTARNAYDPAQGTASEASHTDTTFKGALLDYGTKEVDGTLVKATDRRLLLESAAAPLASDTFVAGGLEYAAVQVREISPGGTPVAYEVQVRR